MGQPKTTCTFSSLQATDTWSWHNDPSKHAGSNPEAFWLQPITANMQPESGWIVYARSDFPHPFQFSLFWGFLTFTVVLYQTEFSFFVSELVLFEVEFFQSIFVSETIIITGM